MSTESQPANPHAFPHSMPVEDGGTAYFHGMTLRDYFAAKAMQAMLVSCVDDTETKVPLVGVGAYQIADIMIEARSK